MSGDFDPVLATVELRDAVRACRTGGETTDEDERIVGAVLAWVVEAKDEIASLRLRVSELSGRQRGTRATVHTAVHPSVQATVHPQSKRQSTPQSNGVSRQSKPQSTRQSSALDRDVDRRETATRSLSSLDLKDPETATEGQDQDLPLDPDLTASGARESGSPATVQVGGLTGGPTLDRDVDCHEDSALDCDMDREVDCGLDRDPDRDLRVAMIGAWDGLGGQHISGTNRRRIAGMVPLVRKLAERDGVEPAALWSAAVARFKGDDEVRRKRLGLGVFCSQLDQWTYDAPPKKPGGNGNSSGPVGDAYKPLEPLRRPS